MINSNNFYKVFKNLLLYKKYSKLITLKEFRRLQKMKRYQYGETSLFGKKIQFVDAITFLGSLEEIFLQHIYKFNPKNEEIVIIDCGANIGLASIYFKIQFPNARIIAFEPDPNIFNIMKQNFLSYEGHNIIARNEAISDNSGLINFHLEGGHSGMITDTNVGEKIISIKSIRLKSLLEEMEEVTFLKIDIEGHEVQVIPDISEQLKKVKFLFLEYHSFTNDEQKLGELLIILKNAGFKYYLKEAANKSFPFLDKEIFLGMDFLTNIFCYKSNL